MGAWALSLRRFLRPIGSKRQSRARGSQRGAEPPQAMRLFRPPLTPPNLGGEREISGCILFDHCGYKGLSVAVCLADAGLGGQTKYL